MPAGCAAGILAASRLRAPAPLVAFDATDPTTLFADEAGTVALTAGSASGTPVRCWASSGTLAGMRCAHRPGTIDYLFYRPAAGGDTAYVDHYDPGDNVVTPWGTFSVPAPLATAARGATLVWMMRLKSPTVGNRAFWASDGWCSVPQFGTSDVYESFGVAIDPFTLAVDQRFRVPFGPHMTGSHVYAVVADAGAGTSRLYVDDADTPLQTRPYDATGFGRAAEPRPWGGRTGELRLYDRPLSAAVLRLVFASLRAKHRIP